MCLPSTINQPNSSPSGRDKLHQGLINKGVKEATIQNHCLGVEPTENRITWFTRRYNELYQLTDSEWMWLDGAAKLHRSGSVTATDPETGRVEQHYYPEGHRWLVGFCDADMEKLEKAKLVRRPRLNGEPRERLLKRTFWELTPSAKHILDYEWSGEHVGDKGEGAVHRLGTWLAYWWAKERYENQGHELHDDVEVMRYHNVDGNTMDLSVEERGYMEMKERGTKQAQQAVIEVEADSRHWSATEYDIYKLGYTARETIWVFPTREVLVKVLRQASERGFTGLHPDQVLDTLAVRNHRDTYNRRLEATGLDAPSWNNLTYHPMSEVWTYKALEDELKEYRREIFDGEVLKAGEDSASAGSN